MKFEKQICFYIILADFVLVYTASSMFRENIVGKLIDPTTDDGETIRNEYEQNLNAAGVQTEIETMHTKRDEIYFTKIHVPWDILLNYAEILNFRVPLQEIKRRSDTEYEYHWSQYFLGLFGLTNKFHQSVPDQPPRYFTADFKKSKLHKYLNSDDTENFFTTTERHQVANEILQTVRYGKSGTTKVGLDQLLYKRIYTAAFPLHDGLYNLKYDSEPNSQEKDKKGLNKRQILYYFWADWSVWYKPQPLDHIQDYFGEKIAFYFAWYGLYTSWLLPLSVIGLLVFLVGVITVNNSLFIQEICNFNDSLIAVVKLTKRTFDDMDSASPVILKMLQNDDLLLISKWIDNGRLFETVTDIVNNNSQRIEYAVWNITMCPACDDGCRPWKLSESCRHYIVGYLTDHPGTVFYAILTSFWSIALLQSWKRLSNYMAYNWNCLDMMEYEERPMAMYTLRAPTTGINPVTAGEEAMYPKGHKKKRYLLTVSLLIMMIVVICIFFVAVVIYKVLITRALLKEQKLIKTSAIVVTMTTFMLTFTIIQLLGFVYRRIAVKLTDWESHRTEREYENYLTLKLFIFESVNYYSSSIYVAFFKGRFGGWPGNYPKIFGAGVEQCHHSTCSTELAVNVVMFLVANSFSNNFLYYLTPIFRSWWFKKRRGIPKDESDTPQWERDYAKPYTIRLYGEYMRLVIQFGFVTMFVSVLPLIPLLALLNNWVEIRLTARKFLMHSRRPVAQRVANMGVWFYIIQSLIYISVMTNGFIIAFTLDFIPKMLFMYHKGIWNLKGYVHFSLSYSSTYECSYNDYRDDNGQVTGFYWELLCVRLLFAVIFEHLVFALMHIVALFFPGISASLDTKIKRERFLNKQALSDADADQTVVRSADQLTIVFYFLSKEMYFKYIGFLYFPQSQKFTHE